MTTHQRDEPQVRDEHLGVAAARARLLLGLCDGDRHLRVGRSFVSRERPASHQITTRSSSPGAKRYFPVPCCFVLWVSCFPRRESAARNGRRRAGKSDVLLLPVGRAGSGREYGANGRTGGRRFLSGVTAAALFPMGRLVQGPRVCVPMTLRPVFLNPVLFCFLMGRAGQNGRENRSGPVTWSGGSFRDWFRVVASPLLAATTGYASWEARTYCTSVVSCQDPANRRASSVYGARCIVQYAGLNAALCHFASWVSGVSVGPW